VTWSGYAFFASLITFLLALLALVLLERLVRRGAPRRRIGWILFDNTYRERHPVRFVFAWIFLVAIWFLCGAVVWLSSDQLDHFVGEKETAHHN